MKILKIITVLTASIVTNAIGQVRLANSIVNTVALNSSSFIDASSGSSNNSSTNIGKGLLYPRTDLTTFATFGGSSIGLATSYPTRYDGFVVYNTGSGNTLATAADAIIAVTPGFWYYDNKSSNVKGGTWKPLGGDSTKYITSAAPIATSTSIDGKQVFAVSGMFVTLGTNALVSIIMPVGMTGYYKMTTYIGGKTFRSDISEFKMTPTVPNTDNVVTGNGLFSEVYPAGTYSYTLEFFR